MFLRLYLENSISKGNIIYNVILILMKIIIIILIFNGKIIDAKLNIFRKKIYRNINFNFNYKNKV